MDKGKSNLSLSKVDILYYLLNNSKIYYLGDDFNQLDFIEQLNSVLQTKYNLQTELITENNINYIIYSDAKGIKSGIGLSVKYKIALLVDNNKLFYEIKPAEWFESNDSGSKIKNLFNTSKEEAVEKEISSLLIKNQSKTLLIDRKNAFIDEIYHKEEVWYYSQAKVDETLLVFLNFSEVKKSDFKIKNLKEIKWKYILTQKRSFIVGFNKKDELVKEIDLSNINIDVKNEIGRNPFVFEDIVFYTTRANSNLFIDVKSVGELSEYERIREIGFLNWFKGKSNKQFAVNLIEKLSVTLNNPFDELVLLYIEFKGEKRVKLFEDFIENNKLIEILNKVLNFEGADKLLIKWVEKWKVESVDAAIINKMLLETMSDSVQANNILEFHKKIRKDFIKINKDKINEIVFDIEYAKHHIKCGLINDAKKILYKILKNLPDESILDILPAKDLDLTSAGSGQILKLTILELLSELETEGNSIKHKRQIAVLQPLVAKRIDDLIAISNNELSGKANVLKTVMQANGIVQKKDIDSNFSYRVLKEKEIKENLVHPASRKGGSFSNIQKWLASVKVPDHSIVKSYSEKLSKNKYSKLNTIVTDIKYALNIENLEVYISRGDKSLGISGFEGSPMFLLVGKEHLDENSAHFLTYNELKFAVAIEISHLYFKHSRITSSDIWKGAFEKGYWVFDTVLSVLPIAGLFGKSIQGVKKLNSVSMFLQKADRIGANPTNSKELLKTTNQAIDIYKTKFNKDKQDNREAEFIASSRIMQLTADRTALAFTDDINSAIRAMFLVSKRYYSELSVVEKYGLSEFLLKKLENGNYKHQELAIRLSNLFAFYISDEYNHIRNLMINK